MGNGAKTITKIMMMMMEGREEYYHHHNDPFIPNDDHILDPYTMQKSSRKIAKRLSRL
jgi:hypothetical protein